MGLLFHFIRLVSQKEEENEGNLKTSVWPEALPPSPPSPWWGGEWGV